jgi:hypothetical protein
MPDVNGNNKPTVADDASVISDFSVGIPDYVSRTEILRFYDKDRQPPVPPPAQVSMI